MKLTHDQVKHIAKLARLSLTEAEVEKFTTQLSKILEYVEQLEKVPTDGVEPTSQVTGLVNVMRGDKVEECGSEEKGESVGAFPDSEGAMLKVHGVFGDK